MWEPISSWTAASKDLREHRPKHLDLACDPGERAKWDPVSRRRPDALFTSTAVTGSAAARKYFVRLAEGALANGWSAAKSN